MSKVITKSPQIYMEKRTLQPYEPMPSADMAKGYYEIGFVLSGSRTIITPIKTYQIDAGMLGIVHPYIYHKIVATSEDDYEYIVIRFTTAYVEPLIKQVGQRIVERTDEQIIFSFSEKSQLKLRQMFLDMLEEYQKELPHREFILQGMLYRLLFTIYEEKLSVSNVIINDKSLTPPIVDAIAYVEEHYMDNPTLEQVAKMVGFSTSYFSRQFSGQLGKSYTEYLDNVKIKHVQMLLTQTKKTIMEIAEETGYCHGNYLNTQFKKKMGMTPGQYRKNNRDLL